jgi:hypothetical protein
MRIICIDSFSVYLRDRDGSIASRILDPQILVYDAFPGTKCFPEYVNCDVWARIGRILLNKFMGTTGRARNVGCSRNEAANAAAFVYVVSNIFHRLTAPSNSTEF